MLDDLDPHGSSTPPAPRPPPKSADPGWNEDSLAVGAAALIGRINCENDALGHLAYHAKLPIAAAMRLIPRRLNGQWRGTNWTAELIDYWPASRREPAFALYELTDRRADALPACLL